MLAEIWRQSIFRSLGWTGEYSLMYVCMYVSSVDMHFAVYSSSRYGTYVYIPFSSYNLSPQRQ